MTGQRLPKLTWIDVVVAAAIATAAGYIVWQAAFVLNYRWNWEAVLGFIARQDPQTGEWKANLLLHGLAATIRIVIYAGLLAAVIGATMGVCRVSRSLYLRLLSRTYVECVRNIPPLVFIFITYFFLASGLVSYFDTPGGAQPGTNTALADFFLGPRQSRAQLISAVIALAVFQGAYVTEIIRAGIQSIVIGQWEAAASVGLSWRKTMRLVVMPQALTKVIPPLAGQGVSLVKESSIVSLLSVPELAFLGNEVATSSGRYFEAWLLVSGIYLCLCLTLSRLSVRLERRLAARQR